MAYSTHSSKIDEKVFPSNIEAKDITAIRIVGDSMFPCLDENDWAFIQLRNRHNVVLADGVYLVIHGQNV
ncbi:MAG: hypothetical protein LBD84_03730 [Campylobacteraceae bacterium]|nr:hypothetical protein [Campylobacteraceae bacterium]